MVSGQRPMVGFGAGWLAFLPHEQGPLWEKDRDSAREGLAVSVPKDRKDWRRGRAEREGGVQESRQWKRAPGSACSGLFIYPWLPPGLRGGCCLTAQASQSKNCSCAKTQRKKAQREALRQRGKWAPHPDIRRTRLPSLSHTLSRFPAAATTTKPPPPRIWDDPGGFGHLDAREGGAHTQAEPQEAGRMHTRAVMATTHTQKHTKTQRARQDQETHSWGRRRQEGPDRPHTCLGGCTGELQRSQSGSKGSLGPGALQGWLQLSTFQIVRSFTQ